MKQIIVFTNGCFDVLHVGHIRLLKKAKELGDFLIVGLNSDESIKRLKGQDRPRFSLNMRYEMLTGIRYVDSIFIFNEDTPEKLLKSLKPDVYVKGEDWKDKKIPEIEFVNSYGGRVVFVPHDFKISTTQILKGEK